MNELTLHTIGVVGTGAMGQGIAQLFAQGGFQVKLFDARPGAAQQAREQLARVFLRLMEKAKLTQRQADEALGRLHTVEALEALTGCELVVEAIVEDLAAKQNLFRQLDELLEASAVLASNTSSLSITAIASVCRHPERVAGLHFFNPVPLMRLVEVIGGVATAPAVVERLRSLVERVGHVPAVSKDSPGFIVNHAGRAFGTEALRILGERVAPVSVIDKVLRDAGGFRMGPFELLDLIGLDVSLPVMESVYNQFYQEPRYRPHPQLRLMQAAGHLGRKSGQGFYRYDGDSTPGEPLIAPSKPAHIPPVWVAADDEIGQTRLLQLLKRLGVDVEHGPHPSAEALCVLAPLGDDVSTSALRHGVDPARTVAVDTLMDIDGSRCLMLNPATRIDMQHAAHWLFSADGAAVAVIRDSCGFIVQRTLASIINLACDIAQQGIASVADIDNAVRLGLGYPKGPLQWGDDLGAARLLQILERMHALTGDPRYRPSGWLRRRARLGLSLRQPENPLSA